MSPIHLMMVHTYMQVLPSPHTHTQICRGYHNYHPATTLHDQICTRQVPQKSREACFLVLQMNCHFV